MRKELSFDDDGRPVLITAAAVSVEEQHRARVRRYLTIMAFRIPALIGAAWAYSVWHNGWVSLAILAASIPLPWMAVLIANDRPPGKPRSRAATAPDAASRPVPHRGTQSHRYRFCAATAPPATGLR